ncbi:hypothetical protein GCM10022215_18310 [Nocardioides fonticola]|uniref:Uncharacterized protein n=1 Tax=Nocardioides fonticola TaxID=450363 RepID=A0ABP7XIY1_9ACTN
MPRTPTATRYLERATQNLALALSEGATPTDVYAVALAATTGGRPTDHTDAAHDVREFAEAIR